MARIRYNRINIPSGSGSVGDPKNNLVVLGIFLAIGVFILIPLFLPFGLVWCIVIGKALFDHLKKNEIIKKDVEGKYSMDWNKAKTSGQRSFEEVRAYSKDAARKYKVHVSESDRMEEKQPYKHSHTPVNYSYDACATERRLEQIQSLKDAGILDEKEYQVRKARILAGK